MLTRADAFETATRSRAEVVVAVDDALITRYRVEVLRVAMKHALPVISFYKPFAEAGGLIAYGASTLDMYRHAADYVDRILKGAKPDDPALAAGAGGSDHRVVDRRRAYSTPG